MHDCFCFDMFVRSPTAGASPKMSNHKCIGPFLRNLSPSSAHLVHLPLLGRELKEVIEQKKLAVNAERYDEVRFLGSRSGHQSHQIQQFLVEAFVCNVLLCFDVLLIM